ncbi:DMT family transporter [Bacillus marasmi]|uniref:DMT family transporter n=1 Tax=Bacillus marasmi TaxID=1926279 RepID=UPI0011C7B3D2|nr:DMT family transporter [Bacillus marasmi]
MKKSIIADFSLMLVALVWGATFVLVQNAISFLPPLTFNGVRFLMASIILGIVLFAFKKDQLAYYNHKLLVSGVIMGMWLFFGYATQTMGLLYTTSSNAGFITGLSVVLVPLFSVVLLKQRPGMNAMIGVFLATTGLYLLTMTGSTSLNLGDFLVLLCAVSFALQIIVTGKYSSSYPTLLLTVVQITTVSIFSLISAFLFEDWPKALQPDILFKNDVVVALLVTSIFATALAFFAQTAFQKYTSATHVALIFALEPVFAAITAYFWGGERLSSGAIFGCVFIFIGMILAELPMGKFFKWEKRNKAA